MTTPAQYLEGLGIKGAPRIGNQKTEYSVSLWNDYEMAVVATRLDWTFPAHIRDLLPLIMLIFWTVVYKLHVTDASYYFATHQLAPFGVNTMEAFYENHKANCSDYEAGKKFTYSPHPIVRKVEEAFISCRAIPSGMYNF